MKIENIILLLFTHFVGDFLLQTDWMALNKSKNDLALGLHSLIYSVLFIYFDIAMVIMCFTSHFIIDYYTSRLNSYLWKNENRHYFFVSIGFDQFLHVSLLFITMNLLEQGLR